MSQRDRTSEYMWARNTFGYLRCRRVALREGRLPDRHDLTCGTPLCYNPKCSNLLYTKNYTCNFCNCAFYCSLECSKYADYHTCLFCYISDIGTKLSKNRGFTLPPTPSSLSLSSSQ